MTSLYTAAGVDIEAGKTFGEMIRGECEEAWPGKGSQIGGFSSLSKIPEDATHFGGSTDGTGTKILLTPTLNPIADRTRKPTTDHQLKNVLNQQFGYAEAIGQDAVAMSAVDLYCGGLLPYALWDSLDVGQLNPSYHIRVIKGIIEACKTSGCFLAGGETAEVPDMLAANWMMNLNTFCVGFGYRDYNPTPRPPKPGDHIYGWPSRSPASNGFSLIREVFGLKSGPRQIRKMLEAHYYDLGESLAEAILSPTPIWIDQALHQHRRGVAFSGHVHITGGGFIDNIPRVLPSDCQAYLDREKWERPPIFGLIQELGAVSQAEMDKVFNQGIMMISFVDPSTAGKFEQGCEARLIGEIAERKNENDPQVKIWGKH